MVVRDRAHRVVPLLAFWSGRTAALERFRVTIPPLSARRARPDRVPDRPERPRGAAAGRDARPSGRATPSGGAARRGGLLLRGAGHGARRAPSRRPGRASPAACARWPSRSRRPRTTMTRSRRSRERRRRPRAAQSSVRDQLVAAAHREPDPSRTAQTALRDALVAAGVREHDGAVAAQRGQRRRRRHRRTAGFVVVALPRRRGRRGGHGL